MFDLITIGNIAADLYFDAEPLTHDKNRYNLAIGGKYFVDFFYSSVGGGASNVAIGAKKLGLRTTACAFVGNNVFRSMILQRFRKLKISTKLLLFSQTYSNISIILRRKDGERTIINYETPHEHLAEEAYVYRKLKKTRSVYFGNLPDVSLAERRKIIAMLKRNNVFIFSNIGTKDCCRPKKYISELLDGVDILIVNTYEFSELVKIDRRRIDFRKNILNLLPVLKDKILIVTDAGGGSYGYNKDAVYYQKAISPRKIVDTTGAGDAYTAGFISRFLKTEDVKSAMKSGSQYAAKIIRKLGAN